MAFFGASWPENNRANNLLPIKAAEEILQLGAGSGAERDPTSAAAPTQAASLANSAGPFLFFAQTENAAAATRNEYPPFGGPDIPK